MKRKSILDTFYENQETVDQVKAKKVVARLEADETPDQKRAREVTAQLEEPECVCPKCKMRYRFRGGDETCPNCGQASKI